jgi:hypothetical protein
VSRRRTPAPEQLTKLRDYYRARAPTTANDHKAASIIAGVTPAMATRAYTRGWPGIESIEAQLARERALAQQDPAVARAEQLAKASLVAAGGLYKSVLRLSTIAESLTNRLDALVVAGDLSQLGADAALAHLKTIARITRDTTAITAKAVETHQLVAGQPTSIVAHVDMSDVPVDLETAKAELEAARRAVRFAEEDQQRLLEDATDGDDGSSIN